MANEHPQLVKTITGKHKVKYGCPKCGEPLLNPLSQAGSQDTCPKCNHSFIVPGKNFKEQIEAEQKAEKQRQEVEQQQKQKLRMEAEQKAEKQRQESETLQKQKLQSETALAKRTPPPPPIAGNNNSSKLLTHLQGFTIIGLLLFGIGSLYMGFYYLKSPIWEYKTLEVTADTMDFNLQSELNRKKIVKFEPELAALGEQGWELVSVFLEIETVHPNYGKSDLVTGLQPNVRPQRLVCILKRQKRRE